MPKNQTQYFPITSGGSPELRALIARGNGFHHIASSELPPEIPSGLRQEWDSAAVLMSCSTGPHGAMLILGHRVHAKVGQLDHDPFALAVSASMPHGSGVLVHHAHFRDRSVALPPAYVAGVTSSGLLNYFRDNPPYGQSSGSTGEAPAPFVEALELARGFFGSSSAA